jgi:hypothetical protein
MNKETVIILVIVGLALFVWVPAIVISICRVLRNEKKELNKN